MKKKKNYIYLFFIVSIIFLLIGTYLTVSAYFGIHAAEIASAQIEFIKNLPFCVDAGKNKKIPLYSQNYFLKKYSFINGYVTADNFENKTSLHKVNVIINTFFFKKINLICLIDTRGRN